MAVPAATQNDTDAEIENIDDENQSGLSESDTISIRKLFNISGKNGIIYDIGVDDKGKKTSGWKIHDGSHIEISGSGLDIFDQVTLWVDGSPYVCKDVGRSGDGRTLDFYAEDFKNVYEEGTRIELQFVDSKNPANNRYLKQGFKYTKDDDKEENKKKNEKEKIEEGGVSQISPSVGPANIVMQSLGTVLGDVKKPGTASVLNSKVKANAKAVSKSSAVGSKKVTSTAQTQFSEDVEGEDTIETSEEVASEVTGSSTVQTSGSVESTTEAEVSGEVSASVSGGAPSFISEEATVSGAVSASVDSKTEGEISSTGQINISGSATPGASSGNSEKSVEVKASEENNQSVNINTKAEISSGQNQSSGKTTAPNQNAPSSGRSKSSPKQQVNTSNKGSSNNVPANSGSGAESGAQSSSPAGQQPDEQDTQPNNSPQQAGDNNPQSANQPVVNSGEPSGQENLDNSPQPEQQPAQKSPAAPSAPLAPGQSPIAPAQSPSPSSPPLPGKGAVDGIESPNKPAEDSESEAARPAGLDKLEKNKEFLGNKLNLPAAGNNPDPKIAKQAAEGGKGIGASLGGGSSIGGNSLDAAAPQAENQQELPNNQNEAGQKQNPENTNQQQDQGQKQPPEDTEDEEDSNQPPVSSPPAGQSQNQASSNPLDSLAENPLVSGALSEATSEMWWWGFGSSAAFFFTGLDFFVGAIVMDIYWYKHRGKPKLFPMKAWQKVVTVFANVFPFIVLLLTFLIVMVVGCNYPVKIKGTYRFTAIGSVIGDDCKYFDISNSSKPTNQ